MYLDDSGTATFASRPFQALVTATQPKTISIACSAANQINQDQLGVFAVSGNITALTVDSITMQ